jgi:protease-4
MLMGVFAALGILGLLIATMAGGLAGGDGQIIEQYESVDSTATHKLAIIDARGIMLTGSSAWAGPGITQSTLNMLDRALEDELVVGVLLALDTPGGAVTDADLIHHKILQLRRAKKRVVVHMGDLCASGGVYAAVAADQVWAHPTTLTGSVGVIIQNLNVHKLLGQYGIEDQSIFAAADGNKPLMSPTRPMKPEHRAILQSVVNEMYVRFVELVEARRKLPDNGDARWRDGRILTANSAKEAGLIDGIGYHEEVLRKLKAISPGEVYTVVRYQRMPSFLGLLEARGNERGPEARILDVLAGSARPMYLYSPSLGR